MDNFDKFPVNLTCGGGALPLAHHYSLPHYILIFQNSPALKLTNIRKNLHVCSNFLNRFQIPSNIPINFNAYL